MKKNNRSNKSNAARQSPAGGDGRNGTPSRNQAVGGNSAALKTNIAGVSTAPDAGGAVNAAILPAAAAEPPQPPQSPLLLHAHYPAGYLLDQLPGQSGLASNSENIAWKCLLMGCGTSNGGGAEKCGNCQCPRPTAVDVSRAELYQQHIKDKHAGDLQAVAVSRSLQLEALKTEHQQEMKNVLEQARRASDANIEAQRRILLAAREKATADAAAGHAKALQAATREHQLVQASSVMAEASRHARELQKATTDAAARHAKELQNEKNLAANALEASRREWQSATDKKVQLAVARSEKELALKYDAQMKTLQDTLAANNKAHAIAVNQHKMELRARVQRETDLVAIVAARRGDIAALQAMLVTSRASRGSQLVGVSWPNWLRRSVPGDVDQLLGQLDLHNIVCNGNANILQALDRHDALGAIPAINALYLFEPTRWTTAAPMTALSIACHQGYLDIVKLLLKIPAIDVNHQDAQNGRTALIWTCQYNFTAIAEVLWADDRINADIQDKEGRTALLWACQNNFNTIARAISGCGKVNVNMQDKEGNTALLWACKNNRLPLVRDLLADIRLNPNLQSTEGVTALMAASSRGNKSIVDCLLADSRVNVNIQDKKGWTALMAVSHRGDVTIMKTLLAIANVNINIQNNNGETALICTCKSGHIHSVKALLADRRIMMNVRDKAGCTALGYANALLVKSIRDQLLAKSAIC